MLTLYRQLLGSSGPARPPACWPATRPTWKGAPAPAASRTPAPTLPTSCSKAGGESGRGQGLPAAAWHAGTHAGRSPPCPALALHPAQAGRE